MPIDISNLISDNSAPQSDFRLNSDDFDALIFDPTDQELEERPFDLSDIVPHELSTDPDEAVDQSTLLTGIIGTSINSDATKERQRFDSTPIRTLKLSKLKSIFKNDNVHAATNLLLSTRHEVDIDEKFKVPFGTGRVSMDTDESMIDYHLTVANCIGLSPLLPNAHSAHRFMFEMDLQKQTFAFKGKHAMLGFDPAGSMLFIGRSYSEDVFLAMAPNTFVRDRASSPPPGHASASSTMSTRHYRQVVLLIAHFLAFVSPLSYSTVGSVFDQDPDSSEFHFQAVTNVLNEKIVKLNFEDLRRLDKFIVRNYDDWLKDAPPRWKSDGFLKNNRPIVVTSRYGQNARIAIPGNEVQEAEDWHKERDYSKIAFLTFAIATSIQCTEIVKWSPIDPRTILEKHTGGIFTHSNPDFRHKIHDLAVHPLLDDDGQEIPVYAEDGQRILRRMAVVYKDEPSCGVLVDLHNVHAMFNPYTFSRHDNTGDDSDDNGEHEELSSIFSSNENAIDFPNIQVDAYPLAFLKSVGNFQADGIPSCFYPLISDINNTVGKINSTASSSRTTPWHHDENENENEDEDENNDQDQNVVSIDIQTPRRLRAVKPVSSQFYNYLSHRVASRAGRHDAQQGTVTAAVAGGFANSEKDKRTARKKQSYCDVFLPSDRFHNKISLPDSPVCCRAEIVYSVDIGALENPSGRSIFENIILPLARSWGSKSIRDVVKDHLIVLKPRIFPFLFDWVSFPITALIRSIFKNEMKSIKDNSLPCPFRLELLAALERTLCFCHTGNTAVLATSLMNPLGLSRGLVRDGFPMMHRIFVEPTIASAMSRGLEIDRRLWPLKKGYPAIASRKAQTLTYSLEHFMTYQATLHIDHALNISNPSSFPDISNDELKKALSICEIAFNAFFEDTKYLVAQGIRSDIRRRKAAASSPQELSSVSDRASIRESSLAAWLKTPFPLAYGRNDPSDVFDLLLHAVSSDADSIVYGLPNWNHFATTPIELAFDFVNVSLPNSSASPRAPIVKKGSFLPVLKVATSSLLNLFAHLDTDKKRCKLLKVFRKAITVFKVEFFPAPGLSDNSRGPPKTVPLFNSWGNLGIPDKFDHVLDGPSSKPSRPILPSSKVAFNLAIANDCNAPWLASDLDLKSLHSVLRKVSLPKDFHPLPFLGVEIVDETYLYVRERYDGRNPLHHLALLVSIVVASTLLPYLFVPTGIRSKFNTALTKDAVTSKFKEYDWVTKKNRSGLVDKSIFIRMITTFVIAVYEKESPLRRRIDSAKRGGLGDDWREKHSVKGVTYTTLIRLGIFWGKGPGAVENGTFGKHWGCHSAKEIQSLYNSLCKKLDSAPFGPYDSLVLLIGDRNARIFFKRKQFKGLLIRPYVAPSPSNLSQNLYMIDQLS